MPHPVLLKNNSIVFSGNNKIKLLNGETFRGFKFLSFVKLEKNICIDDQFENMTALELKVNEKCGVVELKPKSYILLILGVVCAIAFSVVVCLLLFWKFCFRNMITPNQ
jgi:hypothetical protein